jgi:hypothetical protein
MAGRQKKQPMGPGAKDLGRDVYSITGNSSDKGVQIHSCVRVSELTPMIASDFIQIIN